MRLSGTDGLNCNLLKLFAAGATDGEWRPVAGLGSAATSSRSASAFSLFQIFAARAAGRKVDGVTINETCLTIALLPATRTSTREVINNIK